MKRLIGVHGLGCFLVGLVVWGCSARPSARLQRVSSDPTYGYTASNPIKVGGPNLLEGPHREKLFLDELRGANGEAVEYERVRSCCPFATPNGIDGWGMADVFRVTVSGQAKPLTLYLDMYETGSSATPTGFTTRHDP